MDALDGATYRYTNNIMTIPHIHDHIVKTGHAIRNALFQRRTVILFKIRSLEMLNFMFPYKLAGLTASMPLQ